MIYCNLKYLAPIIILFASCKQKAVFTGDYKLIWSDEFNAGKVDTTNWNFETGSHGWGNNEQQYYQKENAIISKGNLVITAKQETNGTNNYTSSRMTTKGKREFLYGKIEARIKIPLSQGVWPAFWMLGANIDAVGWPACGEIDIMEHVNTDSLLYGTLHWDNNGHVQNGDTITYMPAEYHVYAIEWDTSFIRWYVDEKKYHEVTIKEGINNTTGFHKPFFILLNVAIGGNWPGQVIDNKKLPAQMFVDYVRVYSKN